MPDDDEMPPLPPLESVPGALVVDDGSEDDPVGPDHDDKDPYPELLLPADETEAPELATPNTPGSERTEPADESAEETRDRDRDDFALLFGMTLKPEDIISSRFASETERALSGNREPLLTRSYRSRSSK